MASRNINDINDPGHVDACWQTMPDGRILRSIEGQTRFKVMSAATGKETGSFLEYEKVGGTDENAEVSSRVCNSPKSA